MVGLSILTAVTSSCNLLSLPQGYVFAVDHIIIPLNYITAGPRCNLMAHATRLLAAPTVGLGLQDTLALLQEIPLSLIMLNCSPEVRTIPDFLQSQL